MQHHLRRWIDKLPVWQRAQLRTLYSCGISVHQIPGIAKGVYVLSNGRESRFWGHVTCKNPWCCPVCSARRMTEYKERIAAAIDMEIEDGYFGFMASFTIPHLNFMSCRETTDILYNTWTYFRMKSFKKKVHAYQLFCRALGVRDFVRVCEYTHGENGWHPHFHAIFWLPRINADKVLEWQAKLNELWLSTAKRETLKYWREHNLHSGVDLEELVERLYEPTERTGQLGFKISVDKKGKILEAKTSNYICGWGADSELTGNYLKKASHEGHYTPNQILELGEHDKAMEDLYIDYCLAVTLHPVHHRVNFSKNGMQKRIDKWLETHDYSEETDEEKKPWTCVDLISEEDWFDLHIYERTTGAPVFSNILYLAAEHSELVVDYIESIVGKRKRRPLLHEYFETVETFYNSGFLTENKMKKVSSRVLCN